jgi:hypothetical protein
VNFGETARVDMNPGMYMCQVHPEADSFRLPIARGGGVEEVFGQESSFDIVSTDRASLQTSSMYCATMNGQVPDHVAQLIGCPTRDQHIIVALEGTP